jgi:hypothetical protein
MSARPFALSCAKGFDRLSPNGRTPIVLSLSKGKLRANGD